MRVIFMGTPEFAVPTLRGLIQAHEVVAVATRPDSQKGRGQKVAVSPIKAVALEHQIPVLQPARARDEAFIAQLDAFQADVYVVAAYGLLLPEAVLRLPKLYGCINVHASLLPKLRGAAPIQWAVINGDKESGITIMQMDRGLDTGDMLLQAEVEITADDTAGSLHDKLSELGARTLLTALDQFTRGEARRVPQDSEKATYAPMLTKDHGHIDWNLPAERIIDRIRGLNPWPTAYAVYNGEPLKIWRAYAVPETNTPGVIAGFIRDGIVVGAGSGSVAITEVQARGARRMPTADYLRGHAMAETARFE